MKWMERFSLVMRANVTSLRESVENPERMLHQLIIDMDDELDSVRASVAGAIADEIQLGKRITAEERRAREWEERAERSLERQQEEQARSALEQKVLAEQRVESLREEHEKQKKQTRKLQDSVRDLEDKVRQARQKRTLLMARLTRADSTRKINDALDRTHSRSAFAQFNRLEQKADRAEAMEDAYDRLDGRDPDADELDYEFEMEERRDKVSKELEALKKKVGQD